MFHASDLRRDIRDELQTLRRELADALLKESHVKLDGAEQSMNSITAQLDTALKELRDALETQESHVEDFVRDHPIASVASSFALGLVIGLLVRRR